MLSIRIPFYNEAANIILVLDTFVSISKYYSDWELICVDDGSIDGSDKIFKRLQTDNSYPFAKFISYSPNRGYGNAIMTGVRAASGEIIAWTHSDLQTAPEDIFRAYDAFQNSLDKKIIIKGWRAKRKLSQVIFSFGMALVASLILRRKLTEINAQPKLFSKEIVKLLKGAPADFSLDLYLLCIAGNNGYKIKTIDVSFRARQHGKSSWADSWKTKLKTIWRSIKYIWRLRKEV